MGDTNLELTRLLNSYNGDNNVIERVYPLVYNELYSMAHRQLLSERGGHTINTTALVHEAYIKLTDHPPDGEWEGRKHFFGVAAMAMRQILVDYARKRNRKKRSGQKNIQPFEDEIYISDQKAEEIIHLDEALNHLAEMNERQAKVVECRYFAGYNVEETAKILDVSAATVKRDWTTARAWLYIQLSPGE